LSAITQFASKPFTNGFTDLSKGSRSENQLPAAEIEEFRS
jgi:hypothetical protein